MLSVSAPLASAAERGALRCRLRTTLLPRTRPGRHVSNSAAGKLQGGKLREDCVEGALHRGLAGGERGVRGVRGQQRRVGLGALERQDAGVPASKLRCDEGLGGETQQGICYLGVHLQRRVQPVHRGEGRPVRLRPPCRRGRRPGLLW